MNPPMSAPTIPRMMVMMIPPGSRPGMMSFATIPTTRPKRIHPRMPIACLLTFRRNESKSQATPEIFLHKGDAGSRLLSSCRARREPLGTDVAVGASGGKPDDNGFRGPLCRSVELASARRDLRRRDLQPGNREGRRRARERRYGASRHRSGAWRECAVVARGHLGAR